MVRGCGAAGDPHRDVRLVDVVLPAALGDEQHAVEQEQGPLVLGPVDLEGPLQDQLPVGGQVRTLPVEHQGLHLLDPTRPEAKNHNQDQNQRPRTRTRD